jgi:hypothetical protein
MEEPIHTSLVASLRLLTLTSGVPLSDAGHLRSFMYVLARDILFMMCVVKRPRASQYE